MNPFEMVVAIVSISAIASVLRAKYGRPGMSRREMRYRMKNNLMGDPQPDQDAERMREEIKVLKERIAVLERITTETNSAVALDREIEKLR